MFDSPPSFWDTPRRKRPGMSLIPLINVIFLLQCFFLVAGTMERPALLEMEIPIAEQGKPVPEGPIEVVLAPNDTLIVDEEMVSLEMLVSSLRPRLQNNPQQVITLRADATLPAEQLIQVMNRLRAAGGKHLSLVTQSPEGSVP
jgi:biopolymer transport protein ExbD